MDLRIVAVVIGLGAGFIVAGLATEFYEEFAFDVTDGDAGSTVTDGPLADSFQIWGAATMLSLTGGLLWAAHRLEGKQGGLFLATLAISTPAFYAFYQVDHAEGIIGIGVAVAAAWAGLVWMDRRDTHLAMASGLLLASLVPLSDAILWPASFSGSDPDTLSQFTLAATSLAAYLIVLRSVPADGLVRAGTWGVTTASALTIALATLRHFDGGRSDSGWIVALAVLFLVAVTLAAWRPWGRVPETV